MTLQHSLAQTQNLTLTPQLQQSLKILQAGQAELVSLIENELLENPVLEIAEGAEEGDGSSSLETLNVDDSFEIEFQEPSRSQSYADMESAHYEPAALKPSLQDLLLEQLAMVDLTTSQREIFLVLINNLDGNGFLQISNREVALSARSSASEVESVVSILQSLEPAGVGARDLRECLLLQLQRLEGVFTLETAIIAKHSKLLTGGKIKQIAKLEGVTVEAVQRALLTLRTLDPFPAAGISQDSLRIDEPDILVVERGDAYHAVVNQNSRPKIRINSHYQSQTARNIGKSEVRYLSERNRAANWLLHCLDQRYDTLQKIANCLVELESDFFRDGLDSFKPLYLRDIATIVGLHESTVSRAIANKTIQTPHGLFELKYFFTSRIATSMGEVSSLLVKEVIRGMIAREESSRPLSDYAIADALKESKVSIARRTVTKYREELAIPAAPLRKMQALMRPVT